MRMGRPGIALISGLGVALVAAAAVILHQSRRITEVRQQHDAAVQSLREVQAALGQTRLQLSTALQKPSKPSEEDKTAIAQRDARIAQLTNELNDAQASLTQLQENLSTARDESEKELANSTQRYQKLQAEMQGQLDKLQKALSAAQVDAQNSHQKIADLEKANAGLQAESGKDSARTAAREHLLASLQDLDRRREAYLTSIGDRYRSITSQFRTMSGMLNSDRGQGSASAFSGPALDLIQNALTQCDNDFQHLSELNAQAFRIEKELSKK